MKLASWNVNSIRAREARLLSWLDRHKPDVLCLQELKVTDALFPHDAVREAGYHAAVHGQKTYNGVAILSLEPAEDVQTGLGGGAEDPAARFISARVGGIRLINVYVPNGQVVGSDKWAYKLDWMRRLRAGLDAGWDRKERVALCGDFNVAPDERDVQRPAVWEKSVLFHEEAREALRHVQEWGFDDSFRLHHAEGGSYSWWDYRMLSFPKNDGLRLDLILLSPPLAKRCRAASIDREERKGGQPSDHAPVIAELDLS